MSRTLFENSKAALAFAAVTLIGAVSMVGTSDDSGMLPKLASRFGSRPADAAPAIEAPTEEATEAAPATEKKQVSGWYDSPGPSASQNNNRGGGSSEDPPTNPFQDVSPGFAPKPPSSGTANGGAVSAMNAPLAPGAVIVN
ncbi:hypothetical protein [Erythrobacter sp. WG]|uniref:hypothetical protein n=1 Tax=Erythrobacter sp. WG TaxID=2985510 RepID=UPI002270299F|nr:hypothetical protein [Erythrobacter sp. WG]MCX9145822.1 hypothetical protein [Erythrobacter sp. WG]